jgi:hypothetical protein
LEVPPREELPALLDQCALQRLRIRGSPSPLLDEFLAVQRQALEQAAHDLEQLLLQLKVDHQPRDLPLERANRFVSDLALDPVEVVALAVPALVRCAASIR